MPDVKFLLQQGEEAFHGEERENAENLWRDLAELIIPQQSGFFRTRPTKGDRKTRRLYDNTAVVSNLDVAAAIQATLTNQATKWARLSFVDQELMEDKDSATWLQNAGDLILKELSSSNFYTEVGKAYKFLTGLGSMTLHHEEKEGPADTFNGFRFKALHLAFVAWTENKDSIADKIFHKYEMTLRQILENGWDLSDKMRKAAEKDPEQNRDVLMVIWPEEEDKVGGEYGIYYIDREDGTLLNKSKSLELPEYVVRWDTAPGEVYGRGLGHNAYPNIRTLNTAVREGLQSKALVNRPPILVEQDTILTTIDLRPGHKTVVTDVNGLKPFVSGANMTSQQFTEDDLRNSIKQTFLIDKLMLPPRTEVGEMTAYEVAQRTEQMQRVIGPTLSRLNNEFLQPLVLRSFKMMLRKGALGEIPPAVINSGSLNIEISFDNPLSRSQSFEEISTTTQWLGILGQFAQFKPEIVEAVNDLQAVIGMGKTLGVPEEYMNSLLDLMEARQQRAQMAQQQQVLEQMNQAADIDTKRNAQ